MIENETPNLQRLRALLHDATGVPGELAEALREERHRVAGTDPIAHELLAADLRWVARQPEAESGELATACEEARRQWLSLRERALAAAGRSDAAAVFDLADVRGEARLGGMDDLVARCSVTIGTVVAKVGGGEALREEASERFAVLIASVEDPSLSRQVALLRSNSEAMAAVAAHTDDKVLRRLARRLGRAADDRELAARLERKLGRRGVTIYETTNFVLLIVVLTILTIQFTVELSPVVDHTLGWIDGLSCLFFVFAFLFEFALHPKRGSWFVRNFLTDLLPAIPSALWLFPIAEVFGSADNVVAIRSLRVLRVTWAARYVKMLRPLLRSMRLLLFLIRGMDGLVQRFTRMLDREFVFVPAVAEVHVAITEDERRDLLFAALERERELLLTLGGEARAAALLQRARAVHTRAEQLGPARAGSLRIGSSRRDVPIERAVEVLWSVRPQDVSKWLQPADISALDRVLRVVSTVPIRWIPFVGRFAVHPLPATPEERIVGLSRRTAEWIETWHSRLLFHADLHGIVTGPQILDRVASALIKATQRPAVRLLLFGGGFLLLAGVAPDNGFTKAIERIVGLPLIILGSICLIGLALGRWLKSIAGEAADAYRLTSEAHFLPQLELFKRRYEDVDLAFLAERVFDGEESEQEALEILHEQIHSARVGVPVGGHDTSPRLRLMANRVALLYLHFLDGAPLHITDVKTTEQLLANKAIVNLRDQFLRLSRADKKRLRKLRLDEGSLLGGPYLWFSFITESVAVEAAKRIEGYNHYCIPLTELDQASELQREAMAGWLARRRDPKSGRTLAGSEAARVEPYPTTEFNAIDFVGADPERDRHIATIFGEEVVEVMRLDRRTMVREIFGTRPVHHLPKHERSFNPLRFYRGRLSHGRALLAPLLLFFRFFRLIAWVVARVRQIVREVLDPEQAMRRREAGTAPFAVALRKIHRMKAPGLLEAVRIRLWLDPGYSGAPCRWTDGSDYLADSEFERDLAFLHLRERESVELRDRATAIRRAVDELHAAVSWLPDFPAVAGEEERMRGEFAVTCAWIADKDDVRTLLFAERWRTEHLSRLLEEGVAGSWLGDLWRAGCAIFRQPVVDAWLQRHGRDLPPRARRQLRRAWARDLHGTRNLLRAWSGLAAEQSPAEVAIARLHEIYRHGPAIYRDVLTLRAVQSMAVLDVRNYRDLVFELGGYAEDGEECGRWCTLP